MLEIKVYEHEGVTTYSMYVNDVFVKPVPLEVYNYLVTPAQDTLSLIAALMHQTPVPLQV